MEYTLFIGDRTYSSWSLRGWLLFARFGIGCTTHIVDFAGKDVAAQLADLVPARTVPSVRCGDGTVIWDSLALAEELASRHPDAGIWPQDAAARATARSMAAEMHSAYGALRGDCPMNLRQAFDGFAPSEAVQADIARIQAIWTFARDRFGGEGPWLCGEYSAVDAFFAPVTSRIATYDLPMGDEDMAYVAAVLAHPSVRRWRAMGMADTYIQPRTAMGVGYELDLPGRPNPHDPAIAGEIVADDRVAANEFCPFTGGDIAQGCKVQVGERVLGLGDPFTRDKVAADPYCWPELSTLLPSLPSGG